MIETQTEKRWWREPEVLLLILLVIGIYFSRLTTLTIRGEEPRRARVACEILERGDWIVPRQQGQIYLSRPPLGSWPIAVLGMIRGEVDLVAVRLPTVSAILLTTLLIYAYGRTFLSRLGAFSSAAAFASMGQVLEIGRLAETEATFTLLVSSSLLLWHWGYCRGWSATATWMLGYTLSALAGLAKGPQGPVYFAAPVIVYLLARRDWRWLISRSHGAGILAFVVVLGAWQVPYYLATNWESVKGIWTNNAAERFVDNRPSVLLKHLAVYPLEILACMLPWSILLIRFADRRFRDALGEAKPYVLFLLTAIVVTFPSVWFASTAKSRYFMPLYPCFAVLAGLVVDRSWSAALDSAWRRGWNQFLTAMALLAVVVGGLVTAGSLLEIPALSRIAQPAWFAIVYLALALVTAGCLIGLCRGRSVAAGQLAVLVLAAFLGLSYTGVVVNSLVQSSENTQQAVAKAKQILPSGVPFYSLGRIDHLFAYHYRHPITALPAPAEIEEIPADAQYICFNEDANLPVKLPFEWERVITISMERNREIAPRRTVVIARLTGASHTADRTATPPRR